MQKKLRRWRRKYTRWVQRMMRQHPWLATWYPVLEAGALLAVGLLAILILILCFNGRKAPADPVRGEVRDFAGAAAVGAASEAMAEPEAAAVPEATPAPTPVPTPVPTPTPEPVYIDGVLEEHFYQTASAGADYAAPEKLVREKVYVSGKRTEDYENPDPISFVPSSQYTQLEGVTTFRGSNYRDGGAYGVIPENPRAMSIVWEQRIGHLDEWTGVGWTGQASAVRWPEELRLAMNIKEEKKAKDGLIEAIYGTLDGRIYFFDLEDGEGTRSPINIGAPIKGSVSIDPRGVPLLYCGQGIYDVGGQRVKCGTRVWSLIDQSLLFTINGDDEYAIRKWRAFDCAPLVDAGSDTMLQAGENGVLYSVKLNTEWDGKTVSVDPKITRYVYDQSLDGQVGTESSITGYGGYVYMSNNTGIIQCVDVNAMRPVWAVDAKDDIDASMSLEVEEDGSVALYVANELDKRGSRGTSQMFRINALTGELMWSTDSAPIHQNDDNGGGSFATPAIGKHGLSDLVFFHVARVEGGKGMVYALDKKTGSIVWEYDEGRYGWSSPTCVYTPSGKGYVLVGNSSGMLRLLDGLTGEVITAVDLGSNIEGTPIVFDDMLVVGTRGAVVCGVRIIGG